MKRKQLKELHQKSIKELKELVVKTEAELVKLRVEVRGGKAKDTQAVNKKRRDLARVKTILGEKELLELKSPEEHS